MSYRIIVDKDEEYAKKCLNLECGKIFYIGEKCPFCTTVILTLCETCGKIKIDEKWIFPLDAMFKVVAKKRHFTIGDNTVVCPTCKAKITRLILQRAGAVLSPDCVFV